MARPLARIGLVEARQQRAARKRTRPTRPTTARPRLLGTFIVMSATLLVLVLLAPGGALAVSTNTVSVGANTLSTSSMAAPTALSATGGVSNIVLNWTATTTAYATGTLVLRSTTSGGPYSQIAQVTPRTTTTYTDTPAAGTYYYVLQSYFQNWTSANSSQASAARNAQTGFLNCTANAAVTTNSGDNNGYEGSPGNACADDALTATDANSGTSTSTLCTNTGKDRHLFYNYGASVPAGATINGIEVRLDAWASSATSSPFICAELSWDGGTTWTATKTTATLTTSQVTYILGTSSDTWGRTWSSGDFSNANFRLRLTDVASSTARTFDLDYAAVQITYTP
jgi:hypothetical protein